MPFFDVPLDTCRPQLSTSALIVTASTSCAVTATAKFSYGFTARRSRFAARNSFASCFLVSPSYTMQSRRKSGPSMSRATLVEC